MKRKKSLSKWAGITIIALLVASYFIKVSADSGANYVVEEKLLGIIIFHNPFILGLYILIAIALIIKGAKNKR